MPSNHRSFLEQYSLDRGRAALADGDLPIALRWLENAWRLTDGAADIAALYGGCLLVAADRLALEVLTEANQAHTVPELHWLLVRALFTFEKKGEAVDMLAK